MLADYVFQLLHHHATGRPLRNHHVISLALAAALLGELIEAGLIDVGDVVQVAQYGQPPADPTAQMVLAVLYGHRELTTREWLTYFADKAYERMIERMSTAGQITAHKGLLGRVAYRPTDMNTAGLPEALIAYRLRRAEPWDYPERCLAGFILATELDEVMGLNAAQRARLREAVNGLDNPATLRLIAELEAAIGAAALTGHRT